MDDNYHGKGLGKKINLLKITTMKKILISLIVSLLIGLPFVGSAQIRKKDEKDTAKVAVTADTAAVAATAVVVDSLAVKDSVKVTPDTSVVVTPKDCFQEWYEKMRTRGAKPVADGMQPVVITLKSEEACVCLLGQVQVTAGKIVPPLMFQQEDGQFKPSATMGKKLDPIFASSMTEDQLFAITEGMSILFRTNSQEYGRLIFYTFANKGAKANKSAPSPDELLDK